MTSVDGGATWTEPVQYTEFQGYEHKPQVDSLEAGGFAIAFMSTGRRSSLDYTPVHTISFGNPAVNQDLAPPPAIAGPEQSQPWQPMVGTEVTVRARAVGNLSSAPVVLWEKDGVPQTPIPMVIGPSSTSSSPVSAVYAASLGVLGEPGVGVEYHIMAVRARPKQS